MSRDNQCVLPKSHLHQQMPQWCPWACLLGEALCNSPRGIFREVQSSIPACPTAHRWTRKSAVSLGTVDMVGTKAMWKRLIYCSALVLLGLQTHSSIKWLGSLTWELLHSTQQIGTQTKTSLRFCKEIETGLRVRIPSQLAMKYVINLYLKLSL